jgi:phosphoserine phosphatase
VLHVFDMDGTLLRGSTASLEIARAFGAVDALIALESSFMGGDIDTRTFAVAIHELWQGLTPAAVAAAFAASPWLRGIREVCDDIRSRGEKSAVITLSPDFFAVHLTALGFDDVVASRFPAVPFAGPVDPAGILTADDKVRVVAELLARHQLPWEHCVAYGDSRSDVPLFRRLSRTVAVNADPHLDGIAAVRYHGDDLAEAYALGRTLLSESGPLWTVT